MASTHYRRILVPTDGSEGSRAAARAATDLARISGGRLIALHVVPPTNAIASYLWLGSVDPEPLGAPVLEIVSPNHDLALDAVESVASEQGVAVEREQVIDARPAHAIAEAAEQKQCDLVVMSSHGYGNHRPLLTDTATVEIVTECTVPVLVVH